MPTRASAQQAAEGCVQTRGGYRCNWEELHRALKHAHLVALNTDSMDRNTAAQLRELVQSLGKQVAGDGEIADLTFSVKSVPPSGVNLGPGDHPLAALRIYAATPGTPDGTLVWAEDFTGPADRPWPATVHAAIEQFRAHLHKE